MKRVFDILDTTIQQLVKNGNFPIGRDKPNPEVWADLAETDDDFWDEFFKVYGEDNVPEADDFTPEIMDNSFLNMELALRSDGEEPAFARVRKRLKDENRSPIGKADKNPIILTRMFEGEFLDVSIAFEEFQGEVLPVGFKRIDCHIVFNLKLCENYCKKARLVAGDHKTEAPALITHSSVVSRDSLRITL